MVYQYVAYKESGEIVSGRLSASNEEAATELLSYAGYRVVNLKPHIPFINKDKLYASLFPVKPAVIILFYRQLAMLLGSGIDIIAALELLQVQSANRALKRVLGEVVSDLRGGGQFSTALGRHPRVFSSVYCRLLSVGEQSGDLEMILQQVADYMEKEVITAKETKNALRYPVLTFIVTILVIGVLVIFVLPSFSNLYGSMGAELPASTRILITLAEEARNYGMYLLLAGLVIVGAFYLYLKTPAGRYWWDKLLLRLPLVGRVCHLNELARYCRSMVLLFRSGLPLTEVMPLVIQGCNNKAIARALAEVQQDMVQGEGLSRPMGKSKFFLPLLVQMVRVGEETGNLDTTLLAVARSYEAESEDKTHSLIALIQPAMTLTIGAVVGLIALSMTSAMYSMYGQGF